VCLVSDPDGFDDRGLNASALDGLTVAASELPIRVAQFETASEAEIATTLSDAVSAECTLIFVVGYRMADATVALAGAHAETTFVILDFAYPSSLANLKGITFATQEAAYLAGYAAAALSKTNRVSTYGGVPIPTVMSSMSGFSQGALRYAVDQDIEVSVDGWVARDPATSTFVGGFDDSAAARVITQAQLSDGSDVVYPVAGAAGVGTLDEIAVREESAAAVWNDTDGCLALPDSCRFILTSVVKHLDVMVLLSTQEFLDGTLDNQVGVGNLANDGVDIAPFRDFDALLPVSARARITDLRQAIIDGSIIVQPVLPLS
jgi:basic membrane protein A